MQQKLCTCTVLRRRQAIIIRSRRGEAQRVTMGSVDALVKASTRSSSARSSVSSCSRLRSSTCSRSACTYHARRTDLFYASGAFFLRSLLARTVAIEGRKHGVHVEQEHSFVYRARGATGASRCIGTSTTTCSRQTAGAGVDGGGVRACSCSCASICRAAEVTGGQAYVRCALRCVGRAAERESRPTRRFQPRAAPAQENCLAAAFNTRAIDRD